MALSVVTKVEDNIYSPFAEGNFSFLATLVVFLVFSRSFLVSSFSGDGRAGVACREVNTILFYLSCNYVS